MTKRGTAVGLLPQVEDGIDSGGGGEFMGRDGALRGGCGDASRGLHKTGLSRNLRTRFVGLG